MFIIPKQLFHFLGMLFNGWPMAFLAGWCAYLAVYWMCLFQILRATKFDANDKILWFLVITLAPVLGVIAYWLLCPRFVRNHSGPDEQTRGPSSPL